MPEGTTALQEMRPDVGRRFQQQDRSGQCPWPSSPRRARNGAVSPLSPQTLPWLLKSGVLTAYLRGVLPGPSPLFSSSCFGTCAPQQRGSQALRPPPPPRSDGLGDAWPPVPRRSNRSQLSLGAERARAERPGSQETRIQGLGAARISHGTLDKLVSLSRASVS